MKPAAAERTNSGRRYKNKTVCTCTSLERHVNDDPAGMIAISPDNNSPWKRRLPGQTFMKNGEPRFRATQCSSDAGIANSLKVSRKWMARTFCQPISSLDFVTACESSTERSASTTCCAWSIFLLTFAEGRGDRFQ